MFDSRILTFDNTITLHSGGQFFFSSLLCTESEQWRSSTKQFENDNFTVNRNYLTTFKNWNFYKLMFAYKNRKTQKVTMLRTNDMLTNPRTKKVIWGQIKSCHYAWRNALHLTILCSGKLTKWNNHNLSSNQLMYNLLWKTSKAEGRAVAQKSSVCDMFICLPCQMST